MPRVWYARPFAETRTGGEGQARRFRLSRRARRGRDPSLVGYQTRSRGSMLLARCRSISCIRLVGNYGSHDGTDLKTPKATNSKMSVDSQ